MAGAATSRLPLLAAGVLAAGASAMLHFACSDAEAPVGTAEFVLEAAAHGPSSATALGTALEASGTEDSREPAPMPSLRREEVQSLSQLRHEDGAVLSGVSMLLSRRWGFHYSDVVGPPTTKDLGAASDLFFAMYLAVQHGAVRFSTEAATTSFDGHRLELNCRLFEARSFRDDAVARNLDLQGANPRIVVDLREHPELADQLARIARGKGDSEPMPLQDVAAALLELGCSAEENFRASLR